MPRKQLIGDDSDVPHIHAFRVVDLLENLRSLVLHAPGFGPHCSCGNAVFVDGAKFCGCPEIYDFYLREICIVNHYVFWLQVSVAHALAVHVRHSLDQASHDGPHLGLRNACLFMGEHELPQRGEAAVLQN